MDKMSNISTYRIQLDVKDIASQLSISVPKGNTGRRLVIQLVDDGKAFPIARGSYAMFIADKPDGSSITNDCTIQNDTIIYDLTLNTVSCVGNTNCEIDLFDANGFSITTPRFSLIVYETTISKVDLPSESEMNILTAIGINESARKEAEIVREENESIRIVNEETRGLNEAYRVASANTLRAYLGNYELITIETPNDIFELIDNRLVDVSTHNFFLVDDEIVRCISIIGDLITEGDIEATPTDIIEVNKVYFYGGLRFVALPVQAPETSVFNELEDRVTIHEEEARKWALGSTDSNDDQYDNSAKDWSRKASEKIDEITSESNYNHANGFVRLDSNAKIPADLLPLEKTIEMIPIQNENELTYLSQANVGDIAFMSITTDEGKVLTKSWRLYGQYYIRDNWILQSNTFNTSSLYAEESGHSQDTTKVNGVLVRFGDIQKYNEDTKDGLYIITNYADEE